MERNKLAAYIGFALRARKIVLGVNAAEACRGGVFLLLADGSASENTKKQIGRLAKKFSCPVLVVEDLAELTGKAYCKLAAMQEENLARAILKEAGTGRDPQGGYGTWHTTS